MNNIITIYMRIHLLIPILVISTISAAAGSRTYKERLDSIVVGKDWENIMHKHIYEYDSCNRVASRIDYSSRAPYNKWDNDRENLYSYTEDGKIDTVVTKENGEAMCVTKNIYDRNGNITEVSTQGINPGVIRWCTFNRHFYFYNKRQELATYIRCHVRNNKYELKERIDYTYKKGKVKECRHFTPSKKTAGTQIQRDSIILSSLWEENDRGRYDKNGNVLWHRMYDKTDNRTDTLTYTYLEDGRPQQVFCKEQDSAAVIARFEYDAGKSVCIILEQPVDANRDYKCEVEYSADVKAADVECMERWNEFAPNYLIRLFNVNNIDLSKYIHYKILSITVSSEYEDVCYTVRFHYSPIQ